MKACDPEWSCSESISISRSSCLTPILLSARFNGSASESWSAMRDGPSLTRRPSPVSAGQPRYGERNALRPWRGRGCMIGPRDHIVSANRASQDLMRRIVHLRWKKRLRLVEAGSGSLPLPFTPCWPVAGSTGCIIDVGTGEPISRYVHDRPGAMIHVHA
jgi:hypothetical protein